MALTKIEEKEIMTIWEAKKKYADKYIFMIKTQVVDGLHKDLGYVLYVHDKNKEKLGIPREILDSGEVWISFAGWDVEPLGQLGGIEVHAVF